MTAPDYVLEIHTIVHRPADMPGILFAACTHYISPGRTIAGPLLGTARTLADIRALIPASASICIPASPHDVPGIVESWL